ncbi:hypothetical protein Fcan01_24359 [Folsomia candida]|uniref:Uncharacterized protein n=1 Tax=Folsomia candida TaxID=158441 RepID=A0A226D7S4_FOLCA|nr:hypothetical protein Fcan01_24359 [Folsomia candida]
MDPSYLWFRPVTLQSPKSKIFCRILILFPTTFHASLIMFGAVIIIINMMLSLINNLQKLTVRAKINNASKIRDIADYISCMRTYRQLQLLNFHTNEFLYYIFPVTLLAQFFVVTLSVYAAIKLVGLVPHAFILMAVTMLCVDLSVSNISLPVMSSFQEMLLEFLRSFQAQGWSTYTARHLKGCRPLKICLGPFLYVQRETRTEFFALMAYYTISLVISV